MQAPSCTDGPDDFPVVFLVHGGFRSNMGGDMSMFLLAAGSVLESFFAQFGLQPCARVHVRLWVDVGSFAQHVAELGAALASLDDVAAQLHERFQYAEARTEISTGIAATYDRALTGCSQARWCRYVFAMEEDFLVLPPAVTHSAQQLVDLLDSSRQISYLRMFASNWDTPCVTEDASLVVPLVWTGAFSNSAHFVRPSSVLPLWRQVHDPVSTRNWGLECHSDRSRLGLANLCHQLTYFCDARTPYWRDSSGCDLGGYIQCGQRVDTFRQVNKTFCADEQGRRPQYQHCGLAVYGPFGHTAAVHNRGNQFNSSHFWAPGAEHTDPALSSVLQWARWPRPGAQAAV